jgi:uncharacterized protein (UPF0335 family)
MSELQKAGLPPGLYPATWLAAEAERLEQEHDDIELAKKRVIADIGARSTALVDARVNLALLAGSSGAVSAVTEVFERHKSPQYKRLKVIADRIFHLTEEANAIKEDIRDIYAEAKGNGYDVAALRQLVKARLKAS